MNTLELKEAGEVHKVILSPLILSRFGISFGFVGEATLFLCIWCNFTKSYFSFLSCFLLDMQNNYFLYFISLKFIYLLVIFDIYGLFGQMLFLSFYKLEFSYLIIVFDMDSWSTAIFFFFNSKFSYLLMDSLIMFYLLKFLIPKLY